MSNSLQLHGLQHARFPCPSPSPGACSNSCPSSQWCHPTISSSVIPFSCLQSFPVSRSFPVSVLHIRWPKDWSFSFISPLTNIQGWFLLRLTDLISLLSKGLSRVFSNTIVQKHQFLGTQVQLSHPYTTSRKSMALTKWTFVGKVMSLLFNVLSRFVITFLPRIKFLLISWLQSPSAVILEPRKIKSLTVSIVPFHQFAMKWWDQMPWS